MAFVETPQRVQRQFGYDLRVPSGVVSIGGIRVQGVQQRAGQHLVGRRHGALHFVENDALVDEGFPPLVVGLVVEAMALLAKAGRVQAGEEDRVQIDVHQIVEVFAILGGKRIEGPVRGRKGVHEGAQTPFEHGEEGVAHRKFFRAAQDGVLQNVGHAGGVPRDRFERHTECVLGVFTADMDIAGAGGLVGQGIVETANRRQRQGVVDDESVPGLMGGQTRIMFVC